MDPIRAAYQDTRYPAYVHPRTHPARVAAAAALFGQKPAAPERMRVLEIGCGSGANLLAMASSLPEAEFWGMDFSAPDIASALATAREAGLANVGFEVADLMTWVPSGSFDYILAYGLFSWVPDEVKDRLFAVIASALTDGGLGVVSYAVYPGAKIDEGLRDLLVAGTSPESDRVAAAIGTLAFLEQAWSRSPDTVTAAHMIQRAARIRAKRPEYLALDDLGPVRDPCYLTQFVGWASEHGLAYVCDADPAVSLLSSLPPETADEIAGLALPPVEQAQLADYITQRTFRTSVLVKAAGMAAPCLTPGALASLALRAPLQAQAAKGPTRRFKAEGGAEVALSGVVGEVVEGLTRHSAGFAALADVVAQAEAATGHSLAPAERDTLYRDLLTLIGGRMCEISVSATPQPRSAGDRPSATPLNRVLARDHAIVVSAAHTPISLSSEEQALIALLDGKRSLRDIEACLADGPLAGQAEARIAALARAGCLQTSNRRQP